MKLDMPKEMVNDATRLKLKKERMEESSDLSLPG